MLLGLRLHNSFNFLADLGSLCFSSSCFQVLLDALGSRIPLMMLAGLVLGAPTATAQTIVTYQYNGPAFNVAYCMLYDFPSVNCGSGNVTALATLELPTPTYTGNATVQSLTASALGQTLNVETAGGNTYATFVFANGILTNATFLLGLNGINDIYSTNVVEPCASDSSINQADNVFGRVAASLQPVCETQNPFGIWTLVSTQTAGLQITTTMLPTASTGQAYSTAIMATGGTGIGYKWALSAGSLPPGFTFSSEGSCGIGCVDEVLSSTGVPAAQPGTYTFTVQLTDSAGDLATQTLILVVTVGAVPTNFQQVGTQAQPDGTLLLHYSWQSSTGNPADIAKCDVGEFVTYPGYGSDGGTYIWPDPWYFSSPDPTELWHHASDLKLTDTLHGLRTTPVVMPYVSGEFNATQEFRYRCPGQGPTDFPGWSGITIERSIEDVDSCWTYTVIKYGNNQVYGTASAPLPKQACNEQRDGKD